MSSAPQIPSPIFLVASPRSGAETLRQMLTLHPAIAMAPEFDFLVGAISPEGRFMKRDAFLRSVEFNIRFRRLGLTVPPGVAFTGIAHSMLEQVAATKPGAPIVGAVLQQHFDRILWLWPDARFIHLVRDGRDVAQAAVTARRAGNLWHGIADWVDAETLWDRMSHKLPAERQLSLRYEVLASDTAYELQRICEFLGVPFDPAMLGPAPALQRDPMGRWRKADVGELSAAEHRAARWLLQNGYFLSATVRPPAILRRMALNIQNKLALANHRREMLGTGPWLKSAYTARFGRKKARARLKREEAELLARHEN
ncbi:MAG: sulfotransferase [Rhizorhabdus sp.]